MTGVHVIGGGISGLTTAIAAQERGFAVELTCAELPWDTTSAVAAAVWHPFFQPPDETYLRRAAATYERLTKLAAEDGTGVHMRTLTEYFRDSAAPPWWMAAVDGGEEVARPPGYRGAFAMPVPVPDTSRYLRYLTGEFAVRGGKLRRGLVRDVVREAGSAAWVVNCTGFGATALTGDTGLSLVRGVVLRCTKPDGVEDCWIDDSDPLLPTYVIAREDDVILGGTADPGLVATTPSPEVVAGIRRRCAELVPATDGCRVLETKVGFRPARPSVRLERDAAVANLVHNYGHGGAGFTLSWGCAEDTAALLGDPPDAAGRPRNTHGSDVHDVFS
jgi:D-amino-acid oxidase